MATYRVYRLNGDGRISSQPLIFECPDDDRVSDQARQLFDGRGIEVWDGPRLVVRLEPEPQKK
jgi:hypothetical protein